MLELICHHTYKLPRVAIDVSRFDNHGAVQDTVHQGDGAAAGSGAMVFQEANSVIRIPQSTSFSSMRAIRIEMLVRFDQLPTMRMNLIEGHLAFAFFVLPGGALSGTLWGSATSGGAPVWHGVESRPPYAPDGVARTVPISKWTKLAYVHDGSRTLEISIDGVVVGRRNNLFSGIGSVGNFGTTIGSWPDSRRYALRGVVDDVQVWRYDPDAMLDEFFSRPFGASEGACWARLFDSLGKLMSQRDEQLLSLLSALKGLFQQMIRDAAGKPDFLDRNRAYATHFIQLWRAGKLSGSEMHQLLAKWLPEAIKAAGLDNLDTLKQFGKRASDFVISRRIDRFDCDDDFRTWLNDIEDVLRNRKLI